MMSGFGFGFGLGAPALNKGEGVSPFAFIVTINGQPMTINGQVFTIGAPYVG